MKRTLIAWLALLTLAALARAQAPDNVIRLTVQPAAPTVPALKYALLPELIDMLPGNALANYNRAALLSAEHGALTPEHPFWKWLTMPLKDLPVREVRAFVNQRRAMYQELELAARHEHCDWELTERLRSEGVNLLLPEVQRMREFANLLKLRARLELAEGHPDQAARALRAGFAMSRHINESSPVLIGSLVAIAVVAIMEQEVEELMTVPGAPNLYWPLTDLPGSLIDLRRSLQGERMWFEAMLPVPSRTIRDPHAPPLSTEQIDAFITRLAGMYGDRPEAVWRTRLELTLVVARTYDAAREYLVAHGWTAEQVQAMPTIEAVLLYGLAEYDRTYDDMRKWENLPYWQIRPAMQRLAQPSATADRQGRIFVVPLLGDFLPAIQAVYAAQARIERRFAAQRVLEACIAYAAGHGGQWPAALGDVKELPIPLDPVTGKAFEYHVEGARLTLRGPIPEGERAGPANELHYEVTLKQ